MNICSRNRQQHEIEKGHNRGERKETKRGRDIKKQRNRGNHEKQRVRERESERERVRERERESQRERESHFQAPYQAHRSALLCNEELVRIRVKCVN